MKRHRLNFSCPVSLFFILLLMIQRIVYTFSEMTSGIRRYENIEKRPTDTKSYRGLVLDNDFKILLISDSKSSEAVVLLSLVVGSLNDSDECPGIAHFVGNMLNRFGTSEHPDQEIIEILGSRVPRDDLLEMVFPQTKEDEQMFGLEVEVEHLSTVLEIFAQYFNEPLLLTANSRSPLENGIQHVDLFLTPDVLSDEEGAPWRFRQVEKSISAENHPFNHSSYGNADTFSQYLIEEEMPTDSEPLQDEIFEPRPTILHKKLRGFHSKWYSSNIMSLVILGKESLDELERITVPLFKNIQNKHVKKLNFSYEQHPWGQEQLRRKIYGAFNEEQVMSSEEVVRLVFRVPDIRHQYKTRPELYVSDILKRGGPGSLISVLQERKLCTDRLEVKYDVQAGIASFVFGCSVPAKSEIKENEIVELVTQYIRLIHRAGINELIFQERELYDKISSSRHHRMERLDSLCKAMHDYPMEDILTYNYPHEWKPSLIKEFLNYLTPDNMNVFISSKQFENLTAEEVKWHKIPYKVEVIPDSLIQIWKTMEIISDFQAPKPNEFIAEHLNIHPVKEDEPESPYIAYESSRSRIWLSQNDESSKVTISFNLINFRARLDPSNSTLLCIFSELFNHQMVEYKYASNTAKYEWNIGYGEISISIDLSGYLDKMPTLLKKFMSKIRIDHFIGSHLQDQFEKAKVDCINNEKKRRNIPSSYHRLKYVLAEATRSWSSEDTIAASKLLQFDDWKKFVTNMLPRVFIQGLIVGNCVKQIAIDIAKIIEMPFGLDVHFLSQEMLGLLPRAVEMEEGKHFVDIIPRDTQENTHLHYTYYQIGFGHNLYLTITTLLPGIVRRRCHSVEVGDLYFYSNVMRASSAIGLLLSTRPIINQIDHNDLQFEKCLRKVHVALQEMTGFELEGYMRELIQQETRTSPQVHHWDDIGSGFYFFQQGIDERIEDVQPVTKSDVITLLEDTLFQHSPHRRKYTLVLVPKNSELIPSNSIPNTISIDDVIAMKNNSNLMSLPPPFMQINLSQQEGMRTHKHF